MKIIRSRATKQIGDTIEENWKVVGIKVISQPTKGNPPFEAPRLGIYDYEVEPRPVQALKELVIKSQENKLTAMADEFLSKADGFSDKQLCGALRQMTRQVVTIRRVGR